MSIEFWFGLLLGIVSILVFEMLLLLIAFIVQSRQDLK
jgi:hypothetical protein